MKASIIGIGTELTLGQILNRNAQWISEKLQLLGVETVIHLAVPDHEQLILESLDFSADRSDLIFTTGGLGPTTDDFTKEVIAKWTGKQLQYDPDSWDRIVEMFNNRGAVIREFQKQQAYFPLGAKILTNNAGTANAFSMELSQKKSPKKLFVLPGPPLEIETIWADHISKDLEILCKDLDPYLTYSWDCQNAGESEIAFRTEAALQGCSLTKGYRVHKPYVEVKLSFYKSQLKEAKPYIKALDESLASYIYKKFPR